MRRRHLAQQFERFFSTTRAVGRNARNRNLQLLPDLARFHRDHRLADHSARRFRNFQCPHHDRAFENQGNRHPALDRLPAVGHQRDFSLAGSHYRRRGVAPRLLSGLTPDLGRLQDSLSRPWIALRRLFSSSESDWHNYLWATVLRVIAVFIASYVPARRAALLSPVGHATRVQRLGGFPRVTGAAIATKVVARHSDRRQPLASSQRRIH